MFDTDLERVKRKAAAELLEHYRSDKAILYSITNPFSRLIEYGYQMCIVPHPMKTLIPINAELVKIGEVINDEVIWKDGTLI